MFVLDFFGCGTVQTLRTWRGFPAVSWPSVPPRQTSSRRSPLHAGPALRRSAGLRPGTSASSCSGSSGAAWRTRTCGGELRSAPWAAASPEGSAAAAGCCSSSPSSAVCAASRPLSRRHLQQHQRPGARGVACDAYGRGGRGGGGRGPGLRVSCGASGQAGRRAGSAAEGSAAEGRGRTHRLATAGRKFPFTLTLTCTCLCCTFSFAQGAAAAVTPTITSC